MPLLWILKLPLHIGAVFTGAKSFRDNPVLGARLLNRLGLHALRYLLGHLVMRLKWALLIPLMPKDLRTAYHRDGFVVREGFLSDSALRSLKADFAALDGDTRVLSQGGTETQRLLLDKDVLAQSAALRSAVRDPRLKRWIGYAGGRWRRPLLYLQKIRNGTTEGRTDPQKTLHSDTFHPTVKAWLFLEDITPDKGPFTYVPGSHALTKKRLAFEYQTSLTAAQSDDRYTSRGSLRLTEAKRTAMDLAAPKGVTVKAGTLVIANTHGFHGRGQAADGATRLELWAYSRHTPFLPWPGIGIDLWTSVEETLLHRIWRWRDRKAEARGTHPAWRKITTSDLIED